MQRITNHPILEAKNSKEIHFFWENIKYLAYEGDMIASALIANGINIFGHHHKDNRAQGIFCANGQCAKCMVIANGKPVKACMTAICENMDIKRADGLPEINESTNESTNGVPPSVAAISDRHHRLNGETPFVQPYVLIIGGGPSGLSASLELAKYGAKVLLIDDKNILGGKLVLQTHKFFGSVEDSFAGTRGIDIGKKLSDEVLKNENIEVWLNSTAIYVFKDKKVGILKENKYVLIEPQIILNATGAREKFLRFPGNDLVGIYGAGAFQTLVNRDLVKSSKRLFIIGGGNVGLIAGYHALQAGIEVVGLVEAMNKCGGYKVHADKLKRLGVPIYTSHTIVSANGDNTVESITIAEIDKNFNVIKGTEKSFACDTILIAVGLTSLKEFTEQAELSGIKVFATGDALEIAEASSAMFNGKIMGLTVAKELGYNVPDIPEEWHEKAEMLKSHPGSVAEISDFFKKMEKSEISATVPIIHCLQEIPCNPCMTVCPTNSIKSKDASTIMSLPFYNGSCIGCCKCVLICPGLAISLVSTIPNDSQNLIVSIPYEIYNKSVKPGDKLEIVDINGNSLGFHQVKDVKTFNHVKTQIIKIVMPINLAVKAISFKLQDEKITKSLDVSILPEILDENTMICLCEKVDVATVKELIHKGITDINQIKAITRMCMGPCGAKTCDVLIKQLFRQEGVPVENITEHSRHPLFIEINI